MSKVSSAPELKKYMDKKVFVHIQGGRKISGVLRGYDNFLNLVIDSAMDETDSASKVDIGQIVIRGNSVMSMETLEATTGYVSIGGYAPPGQAPSRG